MKRIFLLLITTALLFTVTGCRNEDGNTEIEEFFYTESSSSLVEQLHGYDGTRDMLYDVYASHFYFSAKQFKKIKNHSDLEELIKNSWQLDCCTVVFVRAHESPHLLDNGQYVQFALIGVISKEDEHMAPEELKPVASSVIKF
jgi:hypothetical protein